VERGLTRNHVRPAARRDRCDRSS